jgi:hypothetical protein
MYINLEILYTMLKVLNNRTPPFHYINNVYQFRNPIYHVKSVEQ